MKLEDAHMFLNNREVDVRSLAVFVPVTLCHCCPFSPHLSFLPW